MKTMTRMRMMMTTTMLMLMMMMMMMTQRMPSVAVRIVDEGRENVGGP